MTNYTPTTEQVRDAYVRGMRDTFIASAGEHQEEFDRWVAAHDAAARNSVQPPTREQIAEAIKDEMHRLAHEGLVPKPRHAERIADAVRTLFPQPNPVDPDDEFVAPYKVCEECYEECGARHEHRSGHHDAEPVSIADMAPGTTFRIESPLVSPVDLWTVFLNDVDREKHALSTTGYDWMLDHIDPSTVRDVTPPAATPEEGDRG